MPEKHTQDGVTWCECGCHRDGNSLMHIRPCCNLCYQKYISKDGVVDQERLQALIKETSLKMAEYRIAQARRDSHRQRREEKLKNVPAEKIIKPVRR